MTAICPVSMETGKKVLISRLLGKRFSLNSGVTTGCSFATTLLNDSSLGLQNVFEKKDDKFLRF